jgi:1-aminocyclopropane-1-carboxylate deaminase
MEFDWSRQAQIELAVLRLDLIDPLISGNKWFKLSAQLAQACQRGAEGVISLGGAHSNHLHALAAAGQRFGFASVGLLRGTPQDTPTVRDLQAFGMQLHWLGYGGYRERHSKDFWPSWQARYPGYQCIDEGGLGLLGAHGCAALPGQVHRQLSALGWADYDGWWLAAGTGTTLAGVRLAEERQRMVHGALAVPGNHGVAENIQRILAAGQAPDQGYRLLDASRGGFAKIDQALAQFMWQSEQSSGIALDPLYTAKALMALRDHALAGYFPRGIRLVFVHSGGLQGRRALLPRLASLLSLPVAAFDLPSLEQDIHD